MKRLLIVLALFVILAMPAMAVTPRRGVLAGTVGDTTLLNASWWQNGSMVGEGRNFVPTVGRSTTGLRYSRTRGWVLTLEAPNVAEGANMTARETAIALGTIRKRLPYAKLVSPTFKGTCADGAYNYSLSDVLQEYKKLGYVDKPWFDAIGIQVTSVTAAESICWVERVVNEARVLGYDVGYDTEIWLVGFSAWPSSSPEEQQAYLREVLDYIRTSEIMRYAWHPARQLKQGIWYDYDDLKLIDEDGQLTPLGMIYAGE